MRHARQMVILCPFGHFVGIDTGATGADNPGQSHSVSQKRAGEFVKPADRHNRIVRLVQQHHEMSVEVLASQLAVSRETIRRDLSALDGQGRLRKVHGGARPGMAPAQLAPQAEGPFALRMADNAEAKRRIAARAATLFAAGDSVFIDTGTTTLALAHALVEAPPLVIMTNSWRIASIVSTNADHRVFLLGGACNADAGETLGPLVLEQIRRFHARHVFLTVGAMDTRTIMDFDAQEAEVAQAMIERAEQVTVLADSSKLARRGIFDVAPLSRVNRLVTDRSPPADVAGALLRAGGALIVDQP